MKRLLVLSLLATAALTLVPQARSQPGDDTFDSVLKTSPGPAPQRVPTAALPGGMEPYGRPRPLRRRRPRTRSRCPPTRRRF